MSGERREFFTLHELLMMAALAALGGVTSSVVSMVRAAVHVLIVLPGGMQYLAGIHVLWLVLAVGLVRKPGAATATALLKGSVELLSGNPHGLLVLLYSLFAGVAVDIVWVILGGRDRLYTYVLAGAVGATSNLLVLIFAASLPPQENMLAALAVLGSVAFVSGGVLAGALGRWLVHALAQAGAVGAARQRSGRAPPYGIWRRAGLMAGVIVAVWAAVYLATAKTEATSSATGKPNRVPVSPVALPP